MVIPKCARSLLVAALFSLASAQDCSTECQSYGLDFLDGGFYFQNIESSANFTALEDFTGCQNDVADNILVDPEGNEYYCNTTPMTPDNAPQQITCPITQNQLTSGEWAILVLSNNGNCEPIDYIRSFSLSVGTQVTETVPLTVSVTSTDAPTSTVIDLTTQTITITGLAQTITASGAFASTRTITPFPSFTFTTRGFFQRTTTALVADIVSTTTVTPACSASFVAAAKILNYKVPDAPNTKYAVTISGLKATSTAPVMSINARTAIPRAHSGSTEFKRLVLEARVAEERQGRQAVQKRFPEAPTVTVQDSADGVSTLTVVQTAPPTTVIETSTLLTTTTLTPLVTTNPNALSTETITAPAKTITGTFWRPYVVTTTTQTQYIVATITAPC